VKIGPENNGDTAAAATKLRFEMKRESPLDLSVKTVCRSADSTDDRLHPFGHDIPKVNFKPDFNACRGPSTSSVPATTQQQPPSAAVVMVGGQQQFLHQHHHNAAVYHQHIGPQLTLPPLPPTVPSPKHYQPSSSSSSSSVVMPSMPPSLSLPVPSIVQHHHQVRQTPPALTVSAAAAADDAWRAAIDRQIEQKFNSYTKKRQYRPITQQSPPPPLLQPLLPPPLLSSQPPLLSSLMVTPSPTIAITPQQQQQGQADKRVLEILKHNIETRDQNNRPPQIAEAPSTPAMMVFSTPVRKEQQSSSSSSFGAPLKKTDYYMAERTAVTPFPKKIDYYMDRTSLCNAPRIRTKAERKQVRDLWSDRTVYRHQVTPCVPSPRSYVFAAFSLFPCP